MFSHTLMSTFPRGAMRYAHDRRSSDSSDIWKPRAIPAAAPVISDTISMPALRSQSTLYARAASASNVSSVKRGEDSLETLSEEGDLSVRSDISSFRQSSSTGADDVQTPQPASSSSSEGSACECVPVSISRKSSSHGHSQLVEDFPEMAIESNSWESSVEDISSFCKTLRPLIYGMYALGLLHSRSPVLKIRHQLSTVYSTVVLIVLWLNCFRAFAAYQQDELHTLCFYIKLCIHLWLLLSCACVSQCYFASERIPEFLRIWYSYTPTRAIGDVQFGMSIRRFSSYASLISWVVLMFFVVVLSTWTIMPDTIAKQILTPPFFPNSSPTPAYLIFCVVVMSLHAAAWLFSVSFFFCFCCALKREFQFFLHEVSEKQDESLSDEGSRADVGRSRFEGLCHVAREADGVFGGFLLAATLICVTTSWLVVYQSAIDVAPSLRVVFVHITVMTVNIGYLFALYVPAASYQYHAAVVADTMAKLDLKAVIKPPDSPCQANFFIPKFQKAKLGFTACRMLTVTFRSVFLVALQAIIFAVVLLTRFTVRSDRLPRSGSAELRCNSTLS